MKEILRLVKALPLPEQKKLYSELGALIALYDDNKTVKLVELHQDIFKKPIKFSDTVVDTSGKEISFSVVLNTQWGQFMGEGASKKEARQNASEQALVKHKQPMSNN
jgi:dsRNA-specific ribonuclease